jgi:hypothetical protein
MLTWTRRTLDVPDVGAIGGSFGEYRELLAALDRYESAARDLGPDDPAVLDCIQKIVLWSDQQLISHPTEARNEAVRKVRAAAYAEVARVAYPAFTSAPSYDTAEAVLLAANACLETPADPSFATVADRVQGYRTAVLQYKAGSAGFLNTGDTEVRSLRANRLYYSKPNAATPADVNCGLCTAAAVLTNLTHNLTTTDAVVQAIHPAPNLTAAIVTDLHNLHTTYARVYQHPEAFDQLDRTLTGGGGDLVRFDAVNASMTAGIRRVVTGRGFACVGQLDSRLPVPDARRLMLERKYDGCVFAVLVVSEGHWNYARKTDRGIEFIDYQTDRPDMQGPVAGPSPQMGVKHRDLGEGPQVTFLAFR